MTDGSIYSSIVNLATTPFKWLASVVQRMRKERRVMTAREELFALYDYTPPAGHGTQLAFKAGDSFLLKSDQDQKWWHVKHILSGKNGYVPMSFVARKSEKMHLEWCHIGFSRDEAEKILSKKKMEPGAFIIRTTTDGRNFAHALVLSVKTNFDGERQFLHYLIERNEGKFWLHGNSFPRKFSSVTHLVQYYAGHHSAMDQPLIYSVKKTKVIEVWMIHKSDIEVNTATDKPLGSGYFGKVFKGKLRGDIVAIKTVILERMSKEKFMKEAQIARDFSHKNIVKTIGVCSEPPYIITEFMPGGNLRNYLRTTRVARNDYLPIAQKIACAMAHLEQKGIAHRDLAARNILVGEDHTTIKLADFGLARDIQETEYYSTDSVVFPAKWTAPEAYVIGGKKGKSTSASDVWSFAVVTWEVWSKGAEPYDDLPALEIYRKLKVDNYRLLCPTGCAPQIYEKMLECWNFDPAIRPTFAELYTFFLDPYGTSQAQTEPIPEPSQALAVMIASEEAVTSHSSEQDQAEARRSSTDEAVDSETSESSFEHIDLDSSESLVEPVDIHSAQSLFEQADLHSSQSVVEFEI
ncbi:hypothetical protein PENTCL1PPCAC_1154 [Pristionchus entomophagus]|uniref:Tyrosine-protein kinase n=1 Tax=Pristionchus entomophagus TaxID=358040 RepID=A0AAV5S8Z3_9BILA|nr:hypothetical protein PENTCL1PPCAC_1154 [Pristionchus entomophagus]